MIDDVGDGKFSRVLNGSKGQCAIVRYLKGWRSA